jgi:hypothetical protein
LLKGWVRAYEALVQRRPGDVLQVESEVVEVMPSRSRPDRGTVTVRSETRNQRGEVVQTTKVKLLFGSRNDEAVSASSSVFAFSCVIPFSFSRELDWLVRPTVMSTISPSSLFKVGDIPP